MGFYCVCGGVCVLLCFTGVDTLLTTLYALLEVNKTVIQQLVLSDSKNDEEANFYCYNISFWLNQPSHDVFAAPNFQ